jgi:hypothetical protein
MGSPVAKRGTGAQYPVAHGRLGAFRPPAGALLLGLLAWMVFYTLLAPHAFAGVTHPFSTTFNGTQTPAGEFAAVNGVTVNEANHDVLVEDRAGLPESIGAVDLFKAGTYLSQLTAAATPQEGFSFSNPGALAVDNSATATKGRAYVADQNHSVVDAFSPAGAYLFQLDGSNTPAHSFADTTGVAVDANGNIYVSDLEHNVVDEFNSAGTYVSQIANAELQQPGGLAVDASGDLYVIDAGSRVVEFDPLGQLLGVIDTGALVAVATDNVSGDVYVAHRSEIFEYDSLGALVSRFGASFIGETTGIAVDGSTGEVFVPDAQHAAVTVFGPAATAPDVLTGAASTSGSTQATLEGTINPSSTTLPASYQFQYGTSTAYGEVAPAAPATVGTGTTPQPETVTISGLQANTTYHYRIVGSNVNGPVEGEDATFTTPGPPQVAAEAASRVTASEATLSATVDPNAVDTHYYFQFGLDQSYASGTTPALPGGDVGVSDDPEAVSQSISGLTPGATYHYRVVAVSAEGTTPGADQTFSTYPAPSLALPDNRGYELVSPANKEGGGVYSVGGFATPGHQAALNQPFQSSVDGDSFVYSGSSSSSGNGLLGNEYLASRGATGWSATDISPATAGPGPLCAEPPITTAPYFAFSPDLTLGALAATATAALPSSSGPCYISLYLRDDVHGNYHTLTVGKPANRTSLEFGYGLPELTTAPSAVYMFAGASADFSKSYFAANDALAAPAVDGGKTQNNLYESSGGALTLVNVLPGGATEPNATFGSSLGLNPQEPPDYEHAISTDGSRAYWTDLNTNNPIEATRLFLREGIAPSVEVDAPQGGSGLGGGGQFWTAAADGSKVIFTDFAFAGLTEDTKPGSGVNLYEYDANTHKLKDLTANAEAADVVGVVGASEDASYVYFVSEGVLATGAAEFQPNLYLAHNGAISFIATLSPEDNSNAQGGDSDAPRGDWRATPAYRTARVTPSGTHLVFQSLNSLTGYPNAGQTEVYVYNAESAKLACASCNPTGLSPSGPSVLRPQDGVGTRPRWITDDGSRVFFDSSDALTPRDTNATWDVYEDQAEQPPQLISGGTSSSGSFFDDASPSGEDVFFTTRERLVRQDTDELTDIYDARVGGGFPSSPTPAPCADEACKPAPSAPPALIAPVTVTFAGVTESPAAVASTPKVKLTSKVVRGSKITVALKVPAKGKLSISGANLKTVKRTVAKAGTYKLKVALSAAGKKQLAHKRRLTVKLRVGYTPAVGQASTVTVTLTVKA